MADKKWSELPAAAALTGLEITSVVQGGVNVKLPVADLAESINDMINWTPAKLPGLYARYIPRAGCFEDAAGADRCEPADGIQFYKSATGAPNLSQAAAGARPLWRADPARAEFDGARHYGTIDLPASPTFFSYHVTRFTAVQYHTWYDGDNALYPSLWATNTGIVIMNHDRGGGAAIGSPTAKNDGLWHTFFCRNEAASFEFWIDNVSIAARAVSMTCSGVPVGLFNRPAGSFCTLADVGEFGFCTSIPSAADLTKLHNYLTALVA